MEGNRGVLEYMQRYFLTAAEAAATPLLVPNITKLLYNDDDATAFHNDFFACLAMPK